LFYDPKREQLHFTYTQNDTLQQRLTIGNKLMYSTFSIPVNPETIAGYVATEGRVLNISDVYKIPPTASYGFGEEFDQKVGYRTKSMLTLPLKSANDDILGVLQIINAQNESRNAIPFSEQDEKMIDDVCKHRVCGIGTRSDDACAFAPNDSDGGNA
ncbi:MAG: GAF domain-containing protein, partial [Desulfobacteraceae bacterium]|nr:GAF domain-containing protein [Desulfobacteraceae bacterium]